MKYTSSVHDQEFSGRCPTPGSLVAVRVWLLVLSLFLSFVTPAFAAEILLVDDDDNSPDVRSFYTAALNTLGLVQGTDYEIQAALGM